MGRATSKVPPDTSQALTVTPARVTPAKTERLAYIRERMLRLDWPPGSSKQMAEEWGLHEGTIKADAAEVSREVLSPKNAEALLGPLAQHIADIGRKSIERTEEVVDKDGCVHKIRKPDMHSALRAAVEFGQLLGMRIDRVEQTVRVDQLSDAQMAEQIAIIAAQSPEVRAALAAKGVIDVPGEEAPAEKETKDAE